MRAIDLGSSGAGVAERAVVVEGAPSRANGGGASLARTAGRVRAPDARHAIDERAVTMNPNKALWEKGDFTRIAESMRESGEALVGSLGITKGLKVLDLGCGDGTTAIPEA